MSDISLYKTFEINQLDLLKSELPEQDLKIKFEYQGPFTNEKIREFLGYVKDLTIGNPQAHKKIQYVLIELAQNVNSYSDWREIVIDNGEKKEVGVGALILGETKDNYFFLIGNVVNKRALQVLIRKCDIINSLDRESLRLFKRQQRNLIPGTNNNAHIGLIMVALTIRNKLDVRIKEIDENYGMFILRVFIPKK